jgi:arylsulfatase A-like enzyme
MHKKGITRKTFLKYGLAGAGSVVAAPFIHTTKAATTSDKPNILFICMDQLRSWTSLPEDLPLPAHEKLLKEGIGFNNYHVNQAPCGPSRAVIYTGQQNQKSGVYNNAPTKRVHDLEDDSPTVELKPGFPTIGSMLREVGYYTSYKGKWHLSNIEQTLSDKRGIYPNATDALEAFGFSDYSFNGEHIGLTWGGFIQDGVIAADAINQIRGFSEGKTEGKPWFMAVNLINPHDIIFFDATGKQKESRKTPDLIGPLVDKPGIALYDRDWGFPLPENYYDDLSKKPAAQLRTQAGSSRNFGVIPLDDEKSWLNLQNYYFNCIRDVDRHIMSILDALEETGEAANTIVVLTADHGEMASAHGMRGKSANLYKENLNVPLIIRHPDVKGGKSADTLANALDLAPTLLSMAGVSASEMKSLNSELKGVDISGALTNPMMKTERSTRGAFFNFVSFGGLQPEQRGESAIPDLPRTLLRGIYDGRYKFGRYFSPVEHHMPRDWNTLITNNDLELYDTQTDPNEMNNLAYNPGAYKDLILRLNAQLNDVIEIEIGSDDGAMYPGETEEYMLKS